MIVIVKSLAKQSRGDQEGGAEGEACAEREEIGEIERQRKWQNDSSRRPEMEGECAQRA